MRHAALFAAGTLAGGFARYALSARPWGVFAANLLGCFIIGLCHARGLATEHRLLLMTGFCGALTTLSGLVLEASGLALLRGALYAAGTLLAGFAAFVLGSRL